MWKLIYDRYDYRGIIQGASHAEHSVLGLADVRRGDHHRKTQDLPSIFGQDDAVVPEAGSGVVATGLLLIEIHDLFLHSGLLFAGEFLALALELGSFDLGQHSCGLLASHDCDFSVGPHVHHPWVVSPSAHAVISSAIRSPNYAGNLGHSSSRNSIDHLRPMLGNALMLVLLPNHEPRDILQEDQRHLPLRANLHEVGSLLRALTEEDAVVCNDTHLLVVETTETSDQAAAVLTLVFLEFGAV